MQIFKSDLFRSFAIGFGIASMAICAVMGGIGTTATAHIAPAAQVGQSR